ncbi:MAG TPA: beta-propeller fold lactonase family protein [Pseudonocardiaceae bacterium]|nr:beta-propeller fold lactonase family protein [Pseudonocardiaceae bacterium]
MSVENPEGPPQSGGPDQGPPTGGLPPQYSPPPPGASYPAQPQWAAPAAVVPVVRWRVRDHLFVALTVVVAMIVVVGLGFMWFGNNTGVTRVADQTSTANTNAGAAHKASGPSAGYDLRNGAVFLDSNNADANTVVAFARNADGSLKQIGTYQTGGKGSGTVEDTSNGLVVASTQGTVSPQHDVNDPKFLIVPNLGSGTITVFSIQAHGLKRDSVTISGGLKPISIAVSHGLLYVLQSGEVTNQFVTSATTAIENCTTGQLPSVTGFRIHNDGTLTAIPDSTRLLSGQMDSGCTMIGFTPDGKYLYAAERRAGGPDPKTGLQEGRISSFPVDPSGTLDEPNIQTPAANGLYSFVFSKDGGTMYTADQAGDLGNPNGGLASSYNVDDGQLTPIEAHGVPDNRTDSCWIALTNDNTLAFVSSPFGDNGVGGSISSYRIGRDGSMTLIHSDASSDDGNSITDNHLSDGILDIALSRDSNYLYGLDGLAGGVFAFKVNTNGSLTFIEKIPEFNVTPLDQGGAGGPNGIAAY